jgi:large subunit ribosomal protein L22
MPETVARLRYHRASPSKVRQVLKLIVGKDANDAREILRFTERGASAPVMRLLESAIANAGHNDNIEEEELFVLRAFADEGPTLKRGRPRARGRYGRIKKRTSHITIVVARYEDDELDRRREREAASAGPARISRRRRVAASRGRAQADDHDHDDHDHDHDDHDHDDDDVEVDELETSEADLAEEAEADDDEVDEGEIEAFEDVDAEMEADAADEAAPDDAIETVDETETPDDASDTEASDKEGDQ